MSRKSPAKLGLEQLLGKGSAKTFLERQWPSQTMIAHGSLGRLGGLRSIVALRDVQSLLRAWSEEGVISAWPAKGVKAAFQPNARPPEAAELLERGYTLYFRHVETSVPELEPHLRQIEADLRLPPGTVICEAFASEKGSGANPHFDPNMTFNIQIAGTKTWELAENPNVEHPLYGHSIEEFRDEMAEHWRGPAPTQMPKATHRFLARPGSVVFVPHGIWHTTQAHEPSFAILLTIKAWPLAKVLTDYLFKRLADVPVGREMTTFLGKANGLDEDRKRLRALTRELEQIIQTDDFAEVLDSVRRLDARYAISRGVKLTTAPGKGRQKRLRVSAGKERFEQSITPHLASLIDWINAHPRGFSVRRASTEFPELEPQQILGSFLELCESGLIQKIQ